MSAREEVLARIRGALGEDPQTPDIPRAYRHRGEHQPGAAELVAMLVDRLEDYRATVIRIEAQDDQAIGEAVTRALSSRVISQAITPAGAPGEWTAQLADVLVDDGSLGEVIGLASTASGAAASAARSPGSAGRPWETSVSGSAPPPALRTGRTRPRSWRHR